MSAQAGITCRELIDFIGAYVEHSLSAREQRDFSRHLQGCESCRAYLDSYLTTIRLAKTQHVTLDDAPEDLIRAVLDVKRRNGH